MDLLICPKCKQSVLDDDVSECPFCDAPLPGRVPSKPAPTVPPKGSPKKAAPAKSSASKSTKAVELDDPFAVEASPKIDAIPVSALKSPQRPLKITCPMCDAEGYIPTKAAGKTVKCFRPSCPMPIFTAPGGEESSKPVISDKPAPKKSLINATRVLLVVGVLAVVGAGVAAFYLVPEFLRQSQKQEDPFAKYAKSDTKPITQTEETNPIPVIDETEEEKSKKPVIEVPKVNKELVDVLAAMDAAARSGEANRSRPFSRRQTALAFALAGDLKQADEQLLAFRKVGQQVPYYSIPPLSALAWAEKKPEQAGKRLDEALAHLSKVPPGADGQEMILSLATALVGANRSAEANKLLSDSYQKDDSTRAVCRDFVVRGTRVSRLNDPMANITFLPQWSAVTQVIAGRMGHEAALKWVDQTPSGEPYLECLMAVEENWNEGETGIDEARKNKLQSSDEIARYLARVATRQARQGKQEAAQATLKLAVDALGLLETPGDIKFANLRDVLDWPAVKTDPARIRAAALFEVAIAESQLGESTASSEHYELALKTLRSVAPTTSVMAQLDERIEGLGTNALRAELKKELDLETDDEARRRANDLTRKVQTLQEIANRNFELESKFLYFVSVNSLNAGKETGLLEKVSNTIQESTFPLDPSARQDYKGSWLGRYVAAVLKKLGKTAPGSELERWCEEQNVAKFAHVDILVASWAQDPIQSASVAGPLIQRFYGDPLVIEASGDYVASLVSSGEVAQAYQMLTVFPNESLLLKEELLRWISYESVLKKQSTEALASFRDLNLRPTERISGGLGYVEGGLGRSDLTRQK